MIDFNTPEKLFIDSTSKTLRIEFEKVTGELKFSGRSLPEDAKEFFLPVISWIKNYFKNPNVSTLVTFDIRYYNSSTSKMLLDILYVFKASIKDGNEVFIRWEYDSDDEEMKQAGSDFADLVDIPIELQSSDFI